MEPEPISLPEQTLSPLGEGAMSRVYRARHPRFGDIAVKVLRHHDPAAWRRLQREAAAQSRLSHPNIARVFGFGSFQGQPAILMQRVDGRPLDVVADELPLEARVDLLATICDAVEHAHAAGLIHRDLKPGNVLVEEHDGRLHPYVLDFGLVHDAQARSLTGAGELLGTPAYMSPEQARGDARHVDRRSDVFSLGAILFQLLTGQPPFRGRSVSEVLGQILTADAPLAHRISRNVPLALSRICAQCLERDPARRYPSAAALRLDLQRWLRGESLQARSVGMRYRASRWLRRNRAAGIAGAVVLGLFLVTAAWVVRDRGLAREREEQVARISAASESLRQRMRIARLVPPQSLDSTAAELGAALSQLESQTEALHGATGARARRALAEAWLDLEQPTRALALLRAAEAAAPEDADVLRSLATALVRRYQQMRAPLGDRSERELVELLGPEAAALPVQAEALLRRAAALDPDTPVLARARLALLGQRHDDALSELAAYVPVGVADYQAQVLEAEVLMARARKAEEVGELDAADIDIQRAVEALESAAAIGRSDLRVLTTLCAVTTAGIQLDTHRGLAPPDAPVQATSACDTSIQVHPGHPAGWLTRAQAWGAIARGHSMAGAVEPELAALQAMRADAERAVSLSPDAVEPGLLLARADIRIGQLRIGGFDASLARFEEALRRLEEVLAQHPDNAALLSEAATLYRQRGRLKVNFQHDPGQDYERAATLFAKALARRPDSTALAEDLSLTLVFAFYSERSRNPAAARAMAERAIAAIEPVLARLPDHPDALATQAANLADLWVYLRSLEAGPAPASLASLRDRAHALATHLRAVAPQRAEGYFGAAMLELTAAELNHERGLTDADAQQRAAALLAAAEAAGLDIPAHLSAWLAVNRVREILLAGGDASAALAEARQRIAPALADDADVDARITAQRAALDLAAAEAAAAARAGRPVTPALQRGLRIFAALKASGRDFGSSLCNGGQLYRQQADTVSGPARIAALQAAVAAYRDCIALSPFSFAHQQPRLQEAEQLLAEAGTAR